METIVTSIAIGVATFMLVTLMVLNRIAAIEMKELHERLKKSKYESECYGKVLGVCAVPPKDTKEAVEFIERIYLVLKENNARRDNELW